MSDVQEQTGNPVPTSDRELGLQLRTLTDSLGRDKAVQVTGRSWKTLSRYIDGAEPPFSVVLSLARAAGKSLDGLLADPAAATGSFLATQMGFDAGDDAREFTLVPRYDVAASAGYGLAALAEEVTERLAFKTEWLHDMGLSPAFVGLVTCRGNSQDPVIKDGALMLVDLRPNQTVRSGCFYIIVLDGDVLVKLVNRRVDGTIELKSVNPDYPTEVIDAQQLDRLSIPGQVMWAGQKL